MKKITFILGLIALVGVAYATTNYAPLTGEWTGTITANTKEAKAGVTSKGFSTGSGVEIVLKDSGTGLAGTSHMAGSQEEWKIEGDTFTWNDGMITVNAKAMTYGEIPVWMRTQSGMTEKDTYYAFKFARCTFNETKKACKAGTDIPEGVNKTGVWMFKVEGDKLRNFFYFTNAAGGKRIVEGTLSAKK